MAVRPQLLALALWLGGGACQSESTYTRRVLVLLDSPAEQIQPRRCLPSGRRDLRAGLRRPTVCIAVYRDGSAVWHRDQWGSILRAARTWRWAPADSLRSAHVRDSLTALVVGIAGELGGCTREASAVGHRLIAWNGSRPRLAIHSFERPPAGPDGYALRFEAGREDALCTLSSRRASSIYRRVASPGPLGDDSAMGVLDYAARAAGLPLLRTAVLPEGVRELRLGVTESGLVWQPSPLLRMVQGPRSLHAELFFHWSRVRDSTGRLLQPHWVTEGRFGCRTVQSTPAWAACRVEARSGTSWQDVADSLQALGVWELPFGASTGDPTLYVADQAGLAGEVLVEGRYGRFEYENVNRSRAEDLYRARAAASLIRSLPAR